MSTLKIARLRSDDADFEARFQALIHFEEGDLSRVEATVAEIIRAVRLQGDAAVIDFTTRFDRLTLTPDTLAFSAAEVDQAMGQVSPPLMTALKESAQRIQNYHQRQMAEGWQFEDETGTLLGQRITPIERVGLYVPGGQASYPSSVLMNAIPAKVAGVRELIMTVPTPDGVFNPLVLAAARIAGVDRIFRVGGAQAVAALAFGTATIPAVDKIVGPGNIYVATAKRQVFGRVGIDMIAGPSEILVIAEQNNDPAWIAADLLSQAEHDADAQAILITDDEGFAERVVAAMDVHLKTLSRRDICLASLEKRGAVILVKDLAEGARIASRVAPEHLELAVADPFALLPLIHNAGAIFLGKHTPEAMGDYVAGPNHVLPTSGTARFSSPLGVYDFIKRTSLIGCTPESARRIGQAASLFAASEGLVAHQLSVDLRIGEGS